MNRGTDNDGGVERLACCRSGSWERASTWCTKHCSGHWLLATMPDVQKFQGNESQQQMYKSQFPQLKAEMNILTSSPNAKNRMAEQVASAMAKRTKKDKEMILIKIGWTLAVIPRNFASVIGELMWTVPRPRAFRNLLEKPGRLSLGMSGSNCTDIGIQVQVSSSKCSGMDMKQPSLPTNPLGGCKGAS